MFFFLIRPGDWNLKALVTVLLFLQLFSCTEETWLVLFREKDSGLCKPRDSALSEDLCSALKLLHWDRYLCCLLSKQAHQSSHSHLHFSVLQALSAERREVSSFQYLFAFGLEEEAQRFSIWDQRHARNGTQRSFLNCAQNSSPWVPTFSAPNSRSFMSKERKIDRQIDR